jgi:hypothetical protein
VTGTGGGGDDKAPGGACSGERASPARRLRPILALLRLGRFSSGTGEEACLGLGGEGCGGSELRRRS